jgi:hypothetical protein
VDMGPAPDSLDTRTWVLPLLPDRLDMDAGRAGTAPAPRAPCGAMVGIRLPRRPLPLGGQWVPIRGLNELHPVAVRIEQVDQQTTGDRASCGCYWLR